MQNIRSVLQESTVSIAGHEEKKVKQTTDCGWPEPMYRVDLYSEDKNTYW
jgi:hypothetical protein